MKKLIAALAGAVLIITPVAAQAQHGGGGHGGGGFHGGGFHGGGFHGGGFHGGFHDHDGFHRGFFGDPFFWGAGFGLGLGLAYDPWFWGYPGPYGYYGYPAYYEYDEDYGGPVSSADYYRGSMPADDGAGPAPGGYAGSAPPPPQSQAAPAQACGSWHWDQAAQKYQWATDGC